MQAEFQETVDRPAKPLTTNLGLKAPAGFAQADVDALAQRAISVLRRSTAPTLSKMAPDEAVDYVYAQQPAPTRFDFERDAIAGTQGRPWQWLAASRFPETPCRAKAIRVAANVKKYNGRLDDGTPAPYLTVIVEAHLVQQVPIPNRETDADEPGDTDPATVPIVSYRAVLASGFRPRGGPGFWPSVRTRTSPFGNDGCSLDEDTALLVPSTDPDVLREDLANLKSTLRNPRVSATDFTADTSAAQKKEARREYEQYRDEHCGGEPDN
ncbi:hypothetical protein [Nocardioides aurantiacus]|uniref:hypothetical protein n=1 Tax=Nocardioides aurantiacus TaxID=86796 RepID=UPI0011CD9FC5|nr:hypothetical protein [Nocardioides aurantiacus]